MNYAELIERVEKATGADREIDARLHVALFDPQDVLLDPGHMGKPPHRPAVYGAGSKLIRDGWSQSDWDAVAHQVGASKRYTASLDAALALVEAKLPDHGWFIRRDDTDANGKRAAPVYNAALLYPDALRVCASSAHARPTPALALLAALPRALEEQQ